MRITTSYLRGLLKTVSDIGNWPESGPGSLVIDCGYGRYSLCMITQGTTQIMMSRALKASEMEEFLRGMIAAHDVARLRAHWQVPTRSGVVVMRADERSARGLRSRVTLAAVESTPGETPAPMFADVARACGTTPVPGKDEGVWSDILVGDFEAAQAAGARMDALARRFADPTLGDPWDGCHAAKDGECHWRSCPQLRDGEPAATGRHCPLDRAGDDDGGGSEGPIPDGFALG